MSDNNKYDTMPFPFDSPSPLPIESDGLKVGLRDYFAGQALAGLAASDDHRRYASGCGLTLEQWIERCALEDAQYCYARADAMLAERQKERE